MSRPIYVIDLTYFKKMFWFHNEKQNIHRSEEKQITKVYSDYITDKVFANMDLMINDKSGYGKDSLISMLEEAEFYSEAFGIVEQELTKIIQTISKAGWDDRCKVKIVGKTRAAVFQRLEIYMDLEATLLSMQKEEEEIYVETISGEDIVENPTPEQINDYVRKTKRESSTDSSTDND